MRKYIETEIPQFKMVTLCVFWVGTMFLTCPLFGELPNSNAENAKLRKMAEILEKEDYSEVVKLQQITDLFDEEVITSVNRQLEYDEPFLSIFRCALAALDECRETTKIAVVKEPLQKINQMLNDLILMRLHENNGLPSIVSINLQLQRMYLQSRMLQYNLANANEDDEQFEIELDRLNRMIAFIDDNVIAEGAQFHFVSSDDMIKDIEEIKEMVAEAEKLQ